MNNISERYIDILYNLSKARLPLHVQKAAKDSFIDYLSVTLGGSMANKQADKTFFEENHIVGIHHIIGKHYTTSLHNAVLINAFNAHALELDDGHRVAMMHLEAPIFSALIGVAALHDLTLDEVLRAAVVGYEAAIRLASAIQPSHKKRGFHATGTCGAVGCAIAIATLLKYSKQEMLNTLSAAATSGAGLLEVITGKSEQKPYNIANAAVAGLNAALYGRYFCGPADVLGGDRGFIKNLSSEFNEERLLAPTEQYAIERIYKKPYAACRHCHAPVEAAIRLSKNKQIGATEIKEILVETYDLAVYGHDHQTIDGINSAKMSIPYSVAVAYQNQQCGLELFAEDVIKDSNVLALTNKVCVREDAQLSALVPNKRAAKVSIITQAGEITTEYVEYPKGEPENPITEEELLQKFFSLAKFGGLDDEQCQVIIDKVNSNDSVKIVDILRLIEK